MRLIEDENRALILEGDPLESAEKAFDEKRYIEAFDLLQGFVDFHMINLYIQHKQSTGASPYDLHYAEYRTPQLIKDLFKKQIISGEERSARARAARSSREGLQMQ